MCPDEETHDSQGRDKARALHDLLNDQDTFIQGALDTMTQYAKAHGLIFPRRKKEIEEATKIYWAYLDSGELSKPFFYQGVLISKRYLRQARNTWLLSLPDWLFGLTRHLLQLDTVPWWMIWRLKHQCRKSINMPDHLLYEDELEERETA